MTRPLPPSPTRPLDHPVARRRFLGLAGATLALTQLLRAGQDPDLPGQDIRQDPGDGPWDPARFVRTAWHEAREAGLPLLVLAVPAGHTLDPRWMDSGGSTPREEFWGQVLRNLSDEGALHLAMCRCAAARWTDLAPLLPEGAARPEGADAKQPVAWLVEPDGRTVRAVGGKPRPLPSAWERMQELTREGKTEDEAIALIEESRVERVRAFEADLEAALFDHGVSLTDRSEQSKAKDSIADRLCRGMGLFDHAKVVDEARAIVAAAPPAGTRRGEHGFCATASFDDPPPAEVPDEDRLRVACGIGYAPTASRAFLQFYVGTFETE